MTIEFLSGILGLMDTEQLKDKLIELLVENNSHLKDRLNLERELGDFKRANSELRQRVKELEKRLIDGGFML
jgi:hypothetical protein